MLDLEVQMKILELEGTISSRQIAKILGVSRGSVDNTIRRGYVKKHQRSYRGGDAFRDEKVRRVAPYYCEGCNFRVYFKPCQICVALTQEGKDNARSTKTEPTGSPARSLGSLEDEG